MVKIAVAGGSGQIASEIIDVLAATQKHEILVLSRHDSEASEKIPGITIIKANYEDKAQLTHSLEGVHTVLSFVDAVKDIEGTAQKTLIDASIAAGVKRFAPSEWATSKFEEIPWYASKAIIRAYLAEINKEKKVLEYCLFQPGALLDMLLPVDSWSKHLKPIELHIDYLNRRAIVLDGQDSLFTFTSVKDLANVVALAIDYEEEWPLIGGINGLTIPTSKILELGVKVRGGKPFDITSLKEEDVRAGNLKTSWSPKVAPASVPKDQAEYFSKVILTGLLLSGIHNAWAVSDEWNKLLPDYKFVDPEKFLKPWEGRP